jgi:hypothetical protein
MSIFSLDFGLASLFAMMSSSVKRASKISPSVLRLLVPVRIRKLDGAAALPRASFVRRYEHVGAAQ